MIENAKRASTIADVEAYKTAITTFRDKYDAMPGDMTNASARIPGCNNNCDANPAPAARTDLPGLAGVGRGGDGIVGATDWAGTAAGIPPGGWGDPLFTSQTGITAAASALIAGNPVENETTLFWAHLSGAGLINGVTMQALEGIPAEWGNTHPATEYGGGYVVAHASGYATLPGGTFCCRPGGLFGDPSYGVPIGLQLVMWAHPAMPVLTGWPNFSRGSQLVRTDIALKVDEKIDDGLPMTGIVQVYGNGDSCQGGGWSGGDFYALNATLSAGQAYLGIGGDNTSPTKDCNFVFQLLPL
jgi:hypothetical protein